MGPPLIRSFGQRSPPDASQRSRVPGCTQTTLATSEFDIGFISEIPKIDPALKIDDGA
jgi:hypothetical protein